MKREVQITCTAYHPNGSVSTQTTIEKMGFWRVFREVWKFWKNWNTGFNDYDDMKISFNALHRYGYVSEDER